eukprot:TRINITY_DN2336_c0_g2_i1.p2 TRINITY_DN2336_c0_g2~~TRINITY_DN2336_c0_g2_i1.p2  ORF type:complete len:365 (-),score=89.34 TRINITY_DN2336_c0_g2_i1:1932-3026(-)
MNSVLRNSFVRAVSTRTTDPLRIALIPGDHIGQEVVPAAKQVLLKLKLTRPVEFVELEAGFTTFQKTGNALPQTTIDQLKTCQGAIFGAVSSPSHKVAGYSSPIVAMRKIFGLYANLRPNAAAPANLKIPGCVAGVDMFIVRENTECLYVKQEELSQDGEKAVAKRVITKEASQKVAHVAFQVARKRASARKDGRKPKVTVVHKSNVLSVTDGLFRETCLAVSKSYPDVQVEEQLVDSMVYRMIREPHIYDVVVAPNLYGDILSDAAAALTGGLGLAPSANAGESFVLVEPVHGSAPDIFGKGIANPIATLRAAVMLLDHLNEQAAATQLQTAVDYVLANGPFTPDLGGSGKTQDVVAAVLARL